MTKVADFIANGYYVPTGEDLPVENSQGLMLSGTLLKDFGESDVVVQGSFLHNDFFNPPIILRSSSNGQDRLELAFLERQTRLSLYISNSKVWDIQLSGSNNMDNYFIPFAVKLVGNSLELYVGETLDRYTLGATVDLSTVSSGQSTALNNNTIFGFEASTLFGVFDFQIYNETTDPSIFIAGLPNFNEITLGGVAEGGFREVESPVPTDNLHYENKLPHEYSMAVTPVISNLANGEYKVDVDGILYTPTFLNGKAQFKVDFPPFKKLRLTVLNDAENKAATTIVETHPITYSNSTCYCLGLYDKLTQQKVTKVDGQDIDEGIPYYFSSGEKLGLLNGRLMFDPMGAHDLLQGTQVSFKTFTLTFADNSTRTITVYIIPSEEVGPDVYNPLGMALDVGDIYEIKVSVTGRTQGSVRPKLGNSLASYYFDSNGTEVWELRALENNPLLTFENTGGFDGNPSILSVRKVITKGDATPIRYLRHYLGSSGLDIEWDAFPAGGLFSQTDFVDKRLTGVIAENDTFIVDLLGDVVLPLRKNEYWQFDTPITLPADTTFEINIVASSNIITDEFSVASFCFFGNNELDESGNHRPYMIYNGFTGDISLYLGKDINDDDIFATWQGRYIDYNLPNTYTIARDSSNEITLRVNGELVPKKLSNEHIFDVAIEINTVGFTTKDNPERRFDNTFYKSFEVKVMGVSELEYDFTDVDRDSDPMVVTDLIGSNNCIARNVVAFNNTTAFLDEQATSNTVVEKGQARDVLTGVKYQHGNTNNVSRGWIQCDRLDIENNFPIEDERFQQGISLGTNSEYVSRAQIRSCKVNQNLSSNRGSHTSLGNSDSYLMNNGSEDAGIGAQIHLANSTSVNGNDGCLDSKASATTVNCTFQGANHCYRHHSGGGVHNHINVEYNREIDSQGLLQVIGTNNSINLFNFYLDGVRIHSTEQLINFYNPLATDVDDFAFEVGAITFTRDDSISLTPSTELLGQSQVKVCKTRPRLQDWSRPLYTDFQLQVSPSGQNTWSDLALDSHHLQGTVGEFRRQISLSAGTYDIRLRAKYGAKTGEWLTLPNLEVT